MKSKINPLSILIALIVLNSCTMKEKADLIITNAKIYTVDSAMTIVEAMAIKAGKIIATGSDAEILSKYNSEKSIDMNGKTVYPGFMDAHCHFYGYGITQRYANLVGTSSFDDVLKTLMEFNTAHPDNPWILGRGWDQNDWETKEFPTKEKLDSLFPDKPVMLVRIDGHAILVNQKTLDLADFHNDTKIVGGELLLLNGSLTGVLLDNAADLIKAMVPKLNEKEIESALEIAQKDCFAVGLTSVMDAGLDKNIIEIIDRMNKAGKLKMRIDAMLSPTAENFETYVKQGIYKTPFLHVHSIKLYADGALGSRGACLLSPYSDMPQTQGFLVNSPEYLDSICKIAYEYGFQVNTHAIGDSAVRLMLNTYAQYLQEDNDRRWRIEHSQVVNKQDFKLYKKYNIIPAVNTTHATSDMYWADERLGDKRIKYAYAYHDLLKQNGWLTNGSDFPIESINPIYGFYAGVSRQDLKGWPKGGFQKENALTREQALKAMTIWAAKGSFEENEIGSLEIGKNADFVITDRDIMECEQRQIPKTKVLRTFIGGEEVYSTFH